MSWSVCSYCLFDLIVDFNIINRRKGQVGVEPAALASAHPVPGVFWAYLPASLVAPPPYLACFPTPPR